MSRNNKPILRMAAEIHKQYLVRSSPASPIEFSRVPYERCLKLVRQLRVAHSRDWHGAAECVRRDLIAALESHQRELQSLSTLLSNMAHKPAVVNMRDIYEELTALHDEFDGVSWHAKQGTLSVATESIRLDDVYLGSFEIQLDCRSLPNAHYEIIALDAQPPSCNESVTHPHVQDNVLCEGDAQVPIQQALSDGRLTDFFQLVAITLSTYNASSAYVTLADWDGVPCVDCGSNASEDYRMSCSRCEEVVCDDCSRSCEDCGDHCCGECLGLCHACENCYCGNCLKRCDHCGTRNCSGCRWEERCKRCHETTEQECKQNRQPEGQRKGEQELEEERNPASVPQVRPASPDTAAAVQSHGVGEAAVPAGLR